MMLLPLSEIAMFMLSPTRYPQGNNSGMSTPAMHSLLDAVDYCHVMHVTDFTYHNISTM